MVVPFGSGFGSFEGSGCLELIGKSDLDHVERSYQGPASVLDSFEAYFIIIVTHCITVLSYKVLK